MSNEGGHAPLAPKPCGFSATPHAGERPRNAPRLIALYGLYCFRQGLSPKIFRPPASFAFSQRLTTKIFHCSLLIANYSLARSAPLLCPLLNKLVWTLNKLVETLHKLVETLHKLVETLHKLVETLHKLVETLHKLVETLHKLVESPRRPRLRSPSAMSNVPAKRA
jgi:hypothetical protein